MIDEQLDHWVQAAQLTIEGSLGYGDHASVLAARDVLSGEPVALKVVRGATSEDLAALKREFRLARDLDHENIVRLDWIRTDRSTALMAMERVAGIHIDDATRHCSPETVASMFRQLASALIALHGAGILHLDLKPSNVLVETSGRIVLVDFGLSARTQSLRRLRSGTAAYMAPELLRDAAATQACDWWSFGTLLFQCLTGHRPFPDDPLARGLSQRRGLLANSAALPATLSDLVIGLLRFDASKRFGAREVTAALGLPGARVHSATLIGRGRELQLLQESLGVVAVVGEGGVGKSALIEAHLAAQPGQNLRTRCRPDERVVFNAIDGIVDSALDQCDWLTQRSLGGVLADTLFAESTGQSIPVENPHDRRLALVEDVVGFIDKVCSRAPTTIWLDDAHHADVDSAWLLQRVIPRSSQHARWIVSYRAGPSARWLDELVVQARISLRPLDDESMEQLLATLGHDPNVSLLELLAGSPYLAHRLAVRAVKDDADGLHEVAEVVAVSGSIDRWLLASVCGRSVTRAELRTLERAGLTRWRAWDRLEPSHDRVAEEILSKIPTRRMVQHHSRIADALAVSADRDPRELARHLVGAERPMAAVPFFEEAAMRAAEHLAFEQAAADYRAARLNGGDARALLPREGQMLDYAGRAVPAAEAWLGAMELADVRQRAELRVLAASRFLHGGDLRRGREGMLALLSDAGVQLPRWPLATALATRAWLALTGHRVRTGGSRDRLRVLLEATRGLVMVEPVLADAMAVAALEESLRVDDVESRMQALGLEAVSEANVGGPLRASSRRILQRVEALSRAISTPFATAWYDLCQGCVLFFETRFPEAVATTGRALARLRSECRGRWHEINVATAFHVAATACTGNADALSRFLPAARADAAARGDAYSEIALHSAETYLAAIHEGTVDSYLNAADRVAAQWPREPFTSPLYQHMFATVSCLLYLGRTEEAHARLAATWPRIETAGYLKLEWLGGQLEHLRARVWLAQTPGQVRLNDVSRVASRLTRSSLPGLRGLGHALTATLAVRASEAKAGVSLSLSRECFTMSGMAAYSDALSSLGQRDRSRQHELFVPS